MTSHSKKNRARLRLLETASKPQGKVSRGQVLARAEQVALAAAGEKTELDEAFAAFDAFDAPDQAKDKAALARAQALVQKLLLGP